MSPRQFPRPQMPYPQVDFNTKLNELSLQPRGESNPELTGYPTPVGTTYKWPCGHVFFLPANSSQQMFAGTLCPWQCLNNEKIKINTNTTFPIVNFKVNFV